MPQPPTPNWDISAANPPTLNHVIGNRRLVELVRVTLDSCFTDNRPFPHTLIASQGPGQGKTLLAQIIAKEAGVRLKEIVGQTIQWEGDLNRMLLDLDDGDALFIDEIHTLCPPAQVALFRAVEEGKLFLEAGPFRPKPKKVKLATFTLLAATTDEAGILEPLRDRFRLNLRLSHLTADEIVQLLKQRTGALHWTVEDEVFSLVAARAKGTPRLALRLIDSVYRTSRSERSDVVRTVDAMRTFKLEGLDARGLTKIEQDYLAILGEAGEPVRLNVLATRLGLPPQTIQNIVEVHLVREGLINKIHDGRMLTDKGMEHLRSPME